MSKPFLISKQELVENEQARLIKHIKHPTLPLRLWNYTEHCTYKARNWNYYTRLCRGLVTTPAPNHKERVVALPFSKFFNMNETEETRPEALPNLPYECTDKIDGSLIEVYGFTPEGAQPLTMVHTRGSWDNEQGQKARDYLWNNIRYNVMGDFITEHCATLLFEITYPGNGVVSYGKDTQMTLIGVRTLPAADDYFHSDLKAVAELIGCPVVPLHEELTLDKLGDFNEKPNMEGHVVRFSNGLRIKVKTDWYVRAFRMKNWWRPSRILEALIEVGHFDDSALDEEARKIAADYMEQFRIQYNVLDARVQKALQEVAGKSRKEAALLIKQQYGDVSGPIFTALDGKPYDKILWTMLKEREKKNEQ